ncbi:NAD-dependent succinate-semialdehyde dehydrogenase [Paraburkholderia pallida]|uniref:NAD-dependent succinate-semialdehyde dehydrogenase n=1 Tax=Paraburkholderia pallida TaxID=2547399 RepID=A0A4P7D634_9BURK|nr:NAD-dependent succinate-semialdehyde dehydrogenase [Paraburkholderia pallida]QBR02897.1 NAD-dependent succinate-semialdehyde dehydrogenase [Paraburkholderia pallida]
MQMKVTDVSLSEAVPRTLFIDGVWREAQASFEVVNPATGRALATVADASLTDARDALDAAVAAQAVWHAVAPRERANLFHRAHALLIERAELFAQTMTLESGKPLTESRGEFKLSAEFFLWYAEQIAHLHGTFADGSHGGYRIVATHQPVGPCLLVTPWNFPLLMIARKAGAALAAGCTVVTKSARETPFTSALFVKVLEDAGFPAGVINLIHTTDAAGVSSQLMSDRRLRKVSFTGSTGVGSTLLSQAAQHIINASMELGGDGPFIVLDDADIDAAVESAIVCKFRNAGQACVAANRIIVHEDVEEEFTRKFVEKTRALRVGNGLDTVDVGPIVSARQRDRVERMVNQLTEAGAEVLTGGKALAGDGYFYEPTVMRFTGACEALRDEELFAPVAAIFPVKSTAQALAFANDTCYGLAAYLFTRDISRAIALGEHLDFGMVGINRGIMADPAAPFGGIKASGLGREGGHDGIYEFLEPKYLAITVKPAQEILA